MDDKSSGKVIEIEKLKTQSAELDKTLENLESQYMAQVTKLLVMAHTVNKFLLIYNLIYFSIVI
jgi:hypothetical protein